jgi:hypothetical protein
MTFVGKASNLKQSLLAVVSGTLTGPKLVLLLCYLHRGHQLSFSGAEGRTQHALGFPRIHY